MHFVLVVGGVTLLHVPVGFMHGIKMCTCVDLHVGVPSQIFCVVLFFSILRALRARVQRAAAALDGDRAVCSIACRSNGEAHFSCVH